ncbi:unnamed protein product, partial [Owenia fusiformis]
MHCKRICLNADENGTCVTFHLSMVDFNKPTGSIVKPLEEDLPWMLKVGNRYVYRVKDKVVIREYSWAQHGARMVMLPEFQPGKFAIMTYREFDYLVQCY